VETTGAVLGAGALSDKRLAAVQFAGTTGAVTVDLGAPLVSGSSEEE